MRVDELYLSFMGHVGTRLKVPPSGVVLILGPNGVGKSALIEAVAHCVWGEGLRGRCWDEDAKVETLEVKSGSLAVRRRRKKSKSTLSLGDGVDYETAGKAQQALNALVPGFNVWRRACVLSASDGASFTGATDADRKRLLERMLGIDRFEIAHGEAKADHRTKRTAADSFNLQVTGAGREFEERSARLETAERALADVAPEMDVRMARRSLDTARGHLESTDRDLEALGRDLRTVRDTVAAGEYQATEAVKRQMALGTECPECGQPVGEELQRRLAEAIAETRERVEHAQEDAAGQSAVLEADMEALYEERVVFEQQTAERRLTWQQARAGTGARARWEAEVSAVRDKVAEAGERIRALKVAYAEAAGETEEIGVCCDVLGLSGVRASLLNDALEAINASANGWLAQLATDIRINLTTHSTTKAGKHSDKLGLEVSGVGAKSYAGCSSGQQRRIDVALLFAISEVARAASGQDDWTIWADEVFDALDAEGSEALADVLGDLSRDRAVFVISHAESVISALRPAQVYRFTGPGVMVRAQDT